MKKTLSFFLLFFICQNISFAEVHVENLPAEAQLIDKVWRVVDGDTLKLESDEVVRLIGLDAPEAFFNRKLYKESRKTGQKIQDTQAAGKIASKYLKELLEGRKVRLEFDEKKRDKYGNLLAYVYLENGTSVNALLLHKGYATVMSSAPNVRHQEWFQKLQEGARKNSRGFWKNSKQPSSIAATVYKTVEPMMSLAKVSATALPTAFDSNSAKAPKLSYYLVF